MTVQNGVSEPPDTPSASPNSIQTTLTQLEGLSRSVRSFIQNVAPRAQYRAPIIDWQNPDDYAQKGIIGLGKFLSGVDAETQYVQGLAKLPVAPQEFTSNAPHVLAVWHEFERAAWPLSSINQSIDYVPKSFNGPTSSSHAHVKGAKSLRKRRSGKQIAKVDIVCQGGDEWIKVNTMKESRLLQEFREHDSYINSDYDSDPETSPAPMPNNGHALSNNSLILLAQNLLEASRSIPLLPGRSPPSIRLIFPRLLPLSQPSSSSLDLAAQPVAYTQMSWADERTGRTLDHLQHLGIIVQLGPSPGDPIRPGPSVKLVPSRKIILDLSILVALCCESSHMRLPRNDEEHQARFRALKIVKDADPDMQGDSLHVAKNGTEKAESQDLAAQGDHIKQDRKLILGPHTTASRDLSDQLTWEAQHPLIGELRDRLSSHYPSPRPLDDNRNAAKRVTAQMCGQRDQGDLEVAAGASSIELWVTHEVRKRLPGLVDIIGGPGEQARARALFQHADALGLDGGRKETPSNQRSMTGAWESRNEEYWEDSRWEGQEGILAGMRIGILPPDADEMVGIGMDGPDPTDSIDGFDSTQAEVIETSSLGTTSLEPPYSAKPNGIHPSQASTSTFNSSGPEITKKTFTSSLIPACTSILHAQSASSRGSRPDRASAPSHDKSALAPIQPPTAPRPKTAHPLPPSQTPHPSRLPSGHTMRTLIAGAERGWTVLTNNRGAVGKVLREMGVGEGVGTGFGWEAGDALEPLEGDGQDVESAAASELLCGTTDKERRNGIRREERAAIWIVNPSSLSEWRRREVERENERVRAEWQTMLNP